MQEKELRAVSVWNGKNDPARRINSPGILIDRDNQIKVKIRTRAFRDAGWPQPLDGWALTATAADGTHWPQRGPGEITEHKQYGGFVRLTVPATAMLTPTGLP